MELFTCTLAVRFMSQEDSHCEATGDANIQHFHQESGCPNTIIRPTEVKESGNGALVLC